MVFKLKGGATRISQKCKLEVSLEKHKCLGDLIILAKCTWSYPRELQEEAGQRF